MRIWLLVLGLTCAFIWTAGPAGAADSVELTVVISGEAQHLTRESGPEVVVDPRTAAAVELQNEQHFLPQSPGRTPGFEWLAFQASLALALLFFAKIARGALG